MKTTVEKIWKSSGLWCMAVYNHYGIISTMMAPWRCGYVGLPNKHPLYGIGYNEKHDILRRSDVESQPIGKRGFIPLLCLDTSDERLSPDVYFDVHGSITYADTGIIEHVLSNIVKNPDLKNPDCEMSMITKVTKSLTMNLWWFGFDCNHSEDINNSKPLEYVVSECESLAKQLMIVGKKKLEPIQPKITSRKLEL